MAGLLSGYIRRVVARSGMSADAGNLVPYEIGFDVDVSTFRVGDETATPARVMSDKSSGSFAFPSVSSFTIGGTDIAGGAIRGVVVGDLDAATGWLYKTDVGFNSATVSSEDTSVEITNGDAAVDAPLGMALSQAAIIEGLGLDNLSFVRRAGDTMTGVLNLPALSTTGVSGTDRAVAVKTNILPRWQASADSTPEAGSNSGSYWSLRRYSDAGVAIDDPLRISRADGLIYLSHGIIMPDGMPWYEGAVLPDDALGYLYNDGKGNLSWRYLSGIVVNPSSLLAVPANTAYSVNFTAAGGVGPFTYAVTAGVLPPGVSLSTAGTLSGTPPVAGTYGFTITATDSLSATGYRAYSLLVLANSSAFNILPVSLPAASQGYAYTPVSLTVAGTFTSPVTYAVVSGALPAGMSLASNGVLNGTPSVSGNFTIAVQATDANGVTSAITYTLVVARNMFIFYIDHDVDNVNLVTYAGNPAYSGDFVFIVNTGIYVRSVDPTLPSMRTGILQPGSTMKIINNGNIQAAGGAGGKGTDASGDSASALRRGADGGDAIYLDMDATIDNTNGRIFGGGGGGAGGRSQAGVIIQSYEFGGFPQEAYYWPGGGGGGGQGCYTALGGTGGASMMGLGPSGNAGQNGSPALFGTGGSPGGDPPGYAVTLRLYAPEAGAPGGAWAQSGGTTPGISYGIATPGVGGNGGKAINLHGKTLTQVGGNNANQIKGAVA